MHPTDEEILALFATPGQEPQGFSQLVQKYQRRVYHFCRKMVIDHDDADDLTQDTFIKVWTHLHKFRQDSKLYTWIYRIASNECISFLQKKRRRFMLPIHDVEGELLDKLHHSPHIDGDAIMMKLQEAILKLPEKQRLVFNLRYFEELTYEDMSSVTGTSVGALKASYHHATQKLQVALGQDLMAE